MMVRRHGSNPSGHVAADAESGESGGRVTPAWSHSVDRFRFCSVASESTLTQLKLTAGHDLRVFAGSASPPWIAQTPPRYSEHSLRLFRICGGVRARDPVVGQVEEQSIIPDVEIV